MRIAKLYVGIRESEKHVGEVPESMPIYEYRCEKCGNQFEVIQKFSDEPLKKCSSCKGRLTKLISQTSFQLKGTGWYVTDYAKKSGSKAASGKNGPDLKPPVESSQTKKTDTVSKDTGTKE